MRDHVILITDSHDMIIRYIRVRKGFNSGCANECGSGIRMPRTSDIVFDHISLTWNQDEGFDGAAARNLTYSYNLVGEPVGSTEEAHPTSWAWGGSNSSVSSTMVNIDLHHNLTMNNSHRNPLMRGRSSRVVNNLWYNHRSYANHASGGIDVDIIGNKYKRGPLNPNAAWHEVGA